MVVGSCVFSIFGSVVFVFWFTCVYGSWISHAPLSFLTFTPFSFTLSHSPDPLSSGSGFVLTHAPVSRSRLHLFCSRLHSFCTSSWFWMRWFCALTDLRAARFHSPGSRLRFRLRLHHAFCGSRLRFTSHVRSFPRLGLRMVPHGSHVACSWITPGLFAHLAPHSRARISVPLDHVLRSAVRFTRSHAHTSFVLRTRWSARLRYIDPHLITFRSWIVLSQVGRFHNGLSFASFHFLSFVFALFRIVAFSGSLFMDRFRFHWIGSPLDLCVHTRLPHLASHTFSLSSRHFTLPAFSLFFAIFGSHVHFCTFSSRTGSLALCVSDGYSHSSLGCTGFSHSRLSLLRTFTFLTDHWFAFRFTRTLCPRTSHTLFTWICSSFFMDLVLHFADRLSDLASRLVFVYGFFRLRLRRSLWLPGSPLAVSSGLRSHSLSPFYSRLRFALGSHGLMNIMVIFASHVCTRTSQFVCGLHAHSFGSFSSGSHVLLTRTVCGHASFRFLSLLALFSRLFLVCTRSFCLVFCVLAYGWIWIVSGLLAFCASRSS